MSKPYLTYYRHGEYLDYMTTIIAVLDSKPKILAELNLPRQVLFAQVQQIEAVYKQRISSEITTTITDLAKERDAAIVGIKYITAGYKKHYTEAIANAASLLHQNIKQHGKTMLQRNQSEKTALINSIINDWKTIPKLANASALLQLEGWIDELKHINDNFASAFINRIEEQANKKISNIKPLRVSTTAAYKTVMQHLVAHNTLGTATAYGLVLKQIAVLAKQYNLRITKRNG